MLQSLHHIFVPLNTSPPCGRRLWRGCRRLGRGCRQPEYFTALYTDIRQSLHNIFVPVNTSHIFVPLIQVHLAVVGFGVVVVGLGVVVALRWKFDQATFYGMIYTDILQSLHNIFVPLNTSPPCGSRLWRGCRRLGRGCHPGIVIWSGYIFGIIFRDTLILSSHLSSLKTSPPCGRWLWRGCSRLGRACRRSEMVIWSGYIFGIIYRDTSILSSHLCSFNTSPPCGGWLWRGCRRLGRGCRPDSDCNLIRLYCTELYTKILQSFQTSLFNWIQVHLAVVGCGVVVVGFGLCGTEKGKRHDKEKHYY
jgi:hypothetical protein